MPTPNFNLPLINGASPISIVNDMNALATAADSAMGTLATQGDISTIRTQVTNANKVATEAQTEAVKATGAAEAASEAAATANATANTAKGSAENANNAVTNLNTQVDRIDAHSYFTELERNAANPWPAGYWRAKKSNDGQRFEVNGGITVQPAGGGNYVKPTKLNEVKVNIPGATSKIGIPLFNLGQTPASAVVITSGLYWVTTQNTEGYNFNNAFITEIVVGTDGVIYLELPNLAFQNDARVYGFANTGTWSI